MIRALAILFLLAAPLYAELWQRAEYAGSFRLPHSRTGMASRFGFAGHAMALSADGETLWMKGHGHHQLIAELSIPEPVRSQNPADLPFAEVVTPFLDVTQGRSAGQLGSLAFDSVNDRVWWTNKQGYDVSPAVHRSIGFTADAAHGPWYTDIGNKRTGGYCTLAPLAFAGEYLGGRYLLAGQGLEAGNADASWGPGIVAVSAPNADTPLDQRLETRTLLNYPHEHKYLDAADDVCSVAWISDGPEPEENWLVFSAIVGTGVGDAWYGAANLPPAGRIPDPWKRHKGYHDPPYAERLYVYRMDDVLLVLDGDLRPWEVDPREVVDLRGVLINPGHSWTCLAYDQDRGRLYISEDKGDGTQSRFERTPVVHVFDLRPGEPTDPCAELRVQVARLQARIAELESRIEEAIELLANEP